MSELYPIPFRIFKGKSAMRLSINHPRPAEDGKSQVPGYVYLDIAEVKPGKDASGNRLYDWENKIGVKLGFADLTKISYALSRGLGVSMFHEFGGVSKTIKLDRVEGNSPYFMSVSQNGSEAKKVSVPVSAEEAHALSLFISEALLKTNNW